MKNLFSTLIIAITMFIANQILGQEVNGVATYQSKTKLNINFEDTRIPPERVAHIKEMMKNQLEKKYTLVFNKNASIFKEEEKLDQPNVARGGFRFRMAFLGNNDILYKNITRKELIKETEFSGKKFLISDSLPTYKWKLAQESKMIGSNLCFKATTVIQQPKAKAFKFGPPPPPNSKEAKNDEKDNIQSMENILVTAWYTPSIPISNGPRNFWGLPGLILELNVGNTQFVCTKVSLSNKSEKEIKKPKKGKVISQKDYDELVSKKMKEMRERFRSSRKKSGEGGHIFRMRG